MARKWVLDVQPGKAGAPRFGVSLEAPGGTAVLVAGAENIEDLARQMAAVKGELDDLLSEARKRSKALAPAPRTPAEIWAEMEAAPSEAAMFALFNALDAKMRETAAEYVLTQVGMWKGRGPVFAEHYNAEDHRLEP